MDWIIKKSPGKIAAGLAGALGIPPVIADMLVRRGVRTPDDARDFLKPSLKNLPSPFLLPDMDKAVDRLIKALAKKEKIAIYGDYDADGITATVLLTEMLTSLGASVVTYIPHRVSEGYGLNTKAVETLAESGVNLIVTVDCGVSDIDAVAKAKTAGVDVVITDHHQIPPRLPDALAVVNPQRKESRFPQKELAGVGVSFFLAGGLRQALRERGMVSEADQPELAPLLSLVAIGTVADVMPLTNVNRILVSQGLRYLTDPSQPGLCALKENGITSNGLPLTSEDLGFRLAPRLNAPGRLDSAQPCLDLLLSRDIDEARGYASVLEQVNKERRRLQQEMFRQAEDMLEDMDLDRLRSIILAREGWPRGIAGLAASKLADVYRKPVLLLSVEDGVAVGSGRSIKGFNLFAALDECRDLMLRFGGHEQAAGLAVNTETLAELAQVFEAIAVREIDDDMLIPKLEVEAVLSLHDLRSGLGKGLQYLEPFGEGNPEPVFAVENANVLAAGVVGGNGDHLKLNLNQDGCNLEAIGFGLGGMLPELGRRVSVAVKRHNSFFRGAVQEGWRILDIKRAAG